MRERELMDAMTHAARRAADTAMAAGHPRDSEIVRLSAFAAADEVRRQQDPDGYVTDPAKERIDRETDD